MKKISLNVFYILFSMYFVALFSVDIVTTKVFIHPEVIDKYPGYLRFTGYMHELGKSFDPSNGEACVPLPLYANKCESKATAVSRTRNLNYFFDYVDAKFSRSITFRVGSVTHLISSIGCVFFIFLALLILNKNKFAIALFLSTSFLGLPQLLSLNNLLYRSGKILTCLFISILFYIYVKIRSESHLSKKFITASLIAASLLILSDEQAIICFVIFMVLLFLKNKFNLLLIYSSIILWYAGFRFIIEPFVANYLNEITILRSGTYADPRTFIQFDLSVLGSVLIASGYQVLMSLGTANFLGSWWPSIAVTCIITLMVLIFLKSQVPTSESRLTLARYRKIGLFVMTTWLLAIYLMALRHGFIVKPPLFGDGYYFLVVATFFFCILVACLSQISHTIGLIITFVTINTRNSLISDMTKDAVRPRELKLTISLQKIVGILVVVIVTSNFINTRMTRDLIRERVMGREWVATQLTIQEIIATQKHDQYYSIYEPIYLTHKHFIDSYKLDAK
jgi:hypothetical protein